MVNSLPLRVLFPNAHIFLLVLIVSPHVCPLKVVYKPKNVKTGGPLGARTASILIRLGMGNLPKGSI